MDVLFNRKILCDVYIRWNINVFVRVRGQSSIIIKFVTDVFTSNIISIFVAITKLFSVTRFQICTIFVSFRILDINVLEISVMKKKFFFGFFLGVDSLKYLNLLDSFVNT